MKKILITAFKPFNGRDINPSELILNELTTPKDTDIVMEVLPVEFVKSGKLLSKIVDSKRPDVLLSLGQAGNAPHLSLEKVAVNLDNTKSSDGEKTLPDESGYAPVDEKINPKGPDAYFATLPLWDLVDAVNKAGIPARISYSAGTFICNHVMYVGCELCRKHTGMISGFVHVPFLPSQLVGTGDIQGKYAMEFESMLKGVQTIVNYLSSFQSADNP